MISSATVDFTVKKPPDKIPDLFEALCSEQPKFSPIEPDKYQRFKAFRDSGEWQALSYERRLQTSNEFYRQDDIVAYTEAKWKTQLHNRDSIIGLVDYLRTENDPVKIKAIKNKIQQFLRVIGDQRNVIPALRLDLKSMGLKLSSWEDNDR